MAERVDPVFLITGASSGIGAATARRAVPAGYRVALAARSRDRLDSLARELGGRERALPVVCDVTDWASQQALVAHTVEAYGRLDVAFANAGLLSPLGFLTDDPEHWRAMVLTNVYGAALTVRATLPALQESKGHLVLMGSVAGRRVTTGSLYSCTKFAVTAMAEAVRQELNGSGLRVTLLSPGPAETPIWPDGAPEGSITADDVADAVLYAVTRPPRVDVNEILIRPTAQDE